MVLWQSWNEGFLWGITWSMKIVGATCGSIAVFTLAILCASLLALILVKVFPSIKEKAEKQSSDSN